MAAFIAVMLVALPVAAEGNTEHATEHWGKAFLMFAIVLIVGKIGDLMEKIGQPAVLGQLLGGIVLSVLGYLGVGLMNDISASSSIAFLSALGAMLLLFSIGLESNITELSKVGVNALLVATIGVVVPFVLGTWVLGPWLFSHESTNARLFIGASLVATSVGITASVFRSLGITRTRAAQTVLGAAVIDDVFGLIVLAVVSAIVSGSDVDAMLIATLVAKSFGFLIGAILIGSFGAKYVSRFFSRISGAEGMMLSVAIGLALIFAWLAEVFGLEPIIGAFAAGLVLDAVHFERYDDPAMVADLRQLAFDNEQERTNVHDLIGRIRHGHVEHLVGTLNFVFVPVFFVHTGMQIDIESLLKPNLYAVALVVSIAAILGKLVAGIAARGDLHEKLLVGVSMVPRGEVGLIFAATGQRLGVLSSDLFSVIIMVVIITTFISPPLISRIGSSERLRTEPGPSYTPAD